MADLINGRTPEEIKHGLEWVAFECDHQFCDDCKFAQDCHTLRRYEIAKDALALIEHLEAERDAALAKVPKWISVKDELPSKHLRVLLMNGHRMVTSGHLTYGKTKDGMALWCMEGVKRNDVTHWAEMPEPPKEDA